MVLPSLEDFEDTKGVIKIRKSKRTNKKKKHKQRSTKHYT